MRFQKISGCGGGVISPYPQTPVAVGVEPPPVPTPARPAAARVGALRLLLRSPDLSRPTFKTIPTPMINSVSVPSPLIAFFLFPRKKTR